VEMEVVIGSGNMKINGMWEWEIEMERDIG
jgi:hypothetical protein